jgi:hypothetical protein
LQLILIEAVLLTDTKAGSKISNKLSKVICRHVEQQSLDLPLYLARRQSMTESDLTSTRHATWIRDARGIYRETEQRMRNTRYYQASSYRRWGGGTV